MNLPAVTRVVERRPSNAAVWGFLGPELPPLRSGRPRDPYLEADCHPDAVSHVWDKLGGALSDDCRALLKGRPVLAHPTSQAVLAFAYGTGYALLVPLPERQRAIEVGLSPVMRWSVGSPTDLAKHLGHQWLFGHWRPEELAWCQQACAEAAEA